MIQPNYKFLSEDFISVHEQKNCDFSYILCNMLFRGAREAEVRSFRADGEKAKEYKRLMYELDDLSDDISSLIDSSGRVAPVHWNAVLEAVRISRFLLVIDSKEVASRYEWLVDSLVDSLCEHCGEPAVAA